jgi:hypothetical protein
MVREIMRFFYGALDDFPSKAEVSAGGLMQFKKKVRAALIQPTANQISRII